MARRTLRESIAVNIFNSLREAHDFNPLHEAAGNTVAQIQTVMNSLKKMKNLTFKELDVNGKWNSKVMDPAFKEVVTTFSGDISKLTGVTDTEKIVKASTSGSAFAKLFDGSGASGVLSGLKKLAGVDATPAKKDDADAQTKKNEPSAEEPKAASPGAKARPGGAVSGEKYTDKSGNPLEQREFGWYKLRKPLPLQDPDANWLTKKHGRRDDDMLTHVRIVFNSRTELSPETIANNAKYIQFKIARAGRLKGAKDHNRGRTQESVKLALKVLELVPDVQMTNN